MADIPLSANNSLPTAVCPNRKMVRAGKSSLPQKT